jgi:protein SCO1/2
MKSITLLSTLTLSFALGCGSHESTSSPTHTGSGTSHAVVSKPVRTAAASARIENSAAPSIYDLGVHVTDESGALRQLDSFRGHPLLITMFYAGCANACPLLTRDLKRLDAQLPEPIRSDVRVLMVSFDQPRDTPTVLSRLMRDQSMDTQRWTLANAADDDARQLAGVLGIRYRKLDNGDFFHSSAIVLIDAEGHPSARIDGIGRDPAPILAALHGPSTS